MGTETVVLVVKVPRLRVRVPWDSSVLERSRSVDSPEGKATAFPAVSTAESSIDLPPAKKFLMVMVLPSGLRMA